MFYSIITLWFMVLTNWGPGTRLPSETRITTPGNYLKPIVSMEIDSVTSCRDSFDRLSTNRVISRLQVQSTCPPDGIANMLHDRTELEELSLICVPLSKADIQAIATLRNLRFLDLRGCRLTNDQLDCLSRCPALEELDLRGTSLKTNEIVAFRQHFAKLRVIHVD
ncbi:hypothetical protein [Thalassoglobus polymorphus]|uniref:Leucine Rich repeats (2 copies) n=1 Tax=Thalassoglobus polymorphus TaxID=2527994 RepID=A0A517QUX6_9PLAN|nr:hypothetical protein [Thalassoglobus polymorphus]QDT35401.1 Leucine Rich repeats (2 copies) [Thalassoglobus polymorphus]